MRLSREKLVHLSHVIVDGLEGLAGVKYVRDKNDVRLHILGVLQETMKLEEEMDLVVRRKISSQKRSIPEGSREWDIMYRQYYEEELAKHRRVR